MGEDNADLTSLANRLAALEAQNTMLQSELDTLREVQTVQGTQPLSEESGHEATNAQAVQRDLGNVIPESQAANSGLQPSAQTLNDASSSLELPARVLRPRASTLPMRYPRAPRALYFRTGKIAMLDLEPELRTGGHALLTDVFRALTAIEPKSIPNMKKPPSYMERVTKGRDGRLICNYHTHDDKNRELPVIRVVRTFLEWSFRHSDLPLMLQPLAKETGYVCIRNFECILPIATGNWGVNQQPTHQDVEKEHDMITIAFSTTGIPLNTVMSAQEKGDTYVQAETSVFAMDLAWVHAGPAESVPEGTDFSRGKKYIASTRFFASFVRCDIPKERMDEMLQHDGGASDMPVVFAVP